MGVSPWHGQDAHATPAAFQPFHLTWLPFSRKISTLISISFVRLLQFLLAVEEKGRKQPLSPAFVRKIRLGAFTWQS
jgi:hypothetical protein